MKEHLQIFRDPDELQNSIKNEKRKGKIVTLVPTMGYLHNGHLSLMKEAKKYGDLLIVSIFVNPTQFGPNEDLEKYPRDFKGDEAKCQSVGVDIIFYPTNDNMYPENYQTYVEVLNITKNLCGASRPTHFRGVTTVVAKLFNITLADYAFFGEKDFQQLVTIKRMVKDLNMPVKIIGCPIVREKDGLAMSSRNKYLSNKERKEALSLYKAICRVKEMFENGERDSNTLIQIAKDIISKEPSANIDYLKIVDINTMQDINKIEKDALFALAVKIGSTRLIDNCKLIL